MTIKMLQFGDTHIGVTNRGTFDPETGTSTRVADFLQRMDEIVDYGLKHEADLAVFTGDAFKNRDPNPTHQREFSKRIKRLAEAMPVVMVPGNHDFPGMASRASSIDIFQTLEVENVIIGNQPGGEIIETKNGPVFVAFMPYPQRNRLLQLPEFSDKGVTDLDTSFEALIVYILGRLETSASFVEKDIPRVLVGHFSVSTAQVGAEGSLMLGREPTVPIEALQQEWDYVALGHIHKHQNLGDYPPVVYAGSIERVDFGEEKEDKGFCWVELERGATTWEFVKLNARPFKTITLDIRNVRDEVDPRNHINIRLKEEVVPNGAIVRVIVNMTADQRQAVREQAIHDLLPQAMNVTIQTSVDLESRVRLGTETTESLTPIELLQRYLQLTHHPPEKVTALIEKGKVLVDDSH